MRLSSPKVSKAFMKGANDEGANAIDIGMVSTDGLYFASGFLKKPGVMFTASHNPPEYNGIKFCRANAVPINENTGLQQIKTIIEKEQYHENQRFSGCQKSMIFVHKKNKIKRRGKISKKNILKDYVKHVHSFVDGKKILR